MAALTTSVDPGSETARTNRAGLEALLAEHEVQLDLARLGGGERYLARHRARGKLTRERIELLLDEGSPYLEFSPLAAWGSEFHVGGAMVTGIGVVSGVECVVIAQDPTVRGGSMNPYTLKKNLRALEIARVNRLPLINLVESGGADLPTQADLFVPAGQIFRDLTELSAMGIPTIALVFGNSTAGGAYVPGMCDYSVLVDQRAKVFLGGPPLVKMATGEESDDESLGGAAMHSRVSGLSDYFARDEVDCIRIGREIVRDLNWKKLGPPPEPSREPRFDAEELLDIASVDLRVPFDPREVIARIVDGSEFDEYKGLYGTSLVTGWAAVHGYRVGILANARGVLFMDEAKKASEFILLANQTDTPLLFLQNTTGYMVGKDYEQAGIIKDGAKMINAVTNSTVPHLTVIMGASYGAGNYGMCGRAYRPRFLFAWPSSKMAVMGPQQLAGVLSIVARQSAESSGRDFDEEADAVERARVEEQIERESHAFFNSGKLYDDGVIDPRDTRTVLGLALSAVHSNVVEGRRGFGVFRMQRDRRYAMTVHTLCIANRGEIAARIIRTARAMGITTVALFSDADADLPYVRDADRAVRLPGSRAADTYLAIERVIDAAQRASADAVHPGYGFLSERADFARGCAAAGLTFVGPSPEAIERMGSKLEAKRIMAAAGVPVLPGGEVAPGDAAMLDALAPDTGFPVMVKASMGGGGRGMRLVHDRADLADAVASATREAEAAFGDGTVFLERFVESPRHIEVQVFGDAHGTVVSLFERECSVQRRHQKIIEEAPSPAVDEAMRAELSHAAVAAAKAIGYVGAGTVEFVADDAGNFWFLEMNTRLQVEHPVTEMVTGLDLVAVQLVVAAGEPLPPEALTATITGHAVEARLYAEDVAAGYVPMSGRLDRFVIPTADGARVDAGYETGSVVSAHYDAMLAKVIAHAPTRSGAVAAVARALREAELHGVPTNRDLLVGVLEHDEFAAGRIDTGFLDRHDPAALITAPAEDLVVAGAVAAVLARRAAARAASPLPAGIPQGWRNVGPAHQPVALEHDDRRIVVEVAGDGRAPHVAVDGEPEPVTVFAVTGDEVDFEVRGVRRVVAVHRTESTIYVDGDGTSLTYEVEVRFPLPEEVVAPGSLVAPMPGGVVLVGVAVGDCVDAGAVLVTLEAMKMEHVVRAPAAGTVRDVRVAVGDQVDTGDVLVVIETDDSVETSEPA